MKRGWFILLLLLAIIVGVAIYLLRKGERAVPEAAKEALSSPEKMDLPREKLDEAWKEAKRAKEIEGYRLRKSTRWKWEIKRQK
jgi:hypothetical protein